MIYSHCHPDLDDFDADRAAVLERALAAGVTEIVAIGGGAAPGTLDVALRWPAQLPETAPSPRIWATVGIHPHEAAAAQEPSFAELERLAADPRVIAIGEIGLDYHYDHSPRPVQRQVFARQLELAARLGLPVSIHTREAWADTVAALAAARPSAAGVFHCFSGSRAEAEEAVALGFYLSFSGILTFPRAEELRAAAAAAPADRLLVETDAPYLAPVPHRGRRNEPAFVAATLAALAALRGWSREEAERVTTANFRRAFPRARA